MLHVVTKVCKKCDTIKPVSEFHNDAKRRDGKYPHCKECHYAYMRKRYYTNPNVKPLRLAAYARRKDDPDFIVAAKLRSEKHFQSLTGRAKSLLRCAQRSPDGCTIDLEWVKRGIEQGVCPVTGIAFDLTNGHQKITGRAKNPYAPSLDRIDPKGSYSPDNTRVVIWQYNMMKGEVSDAEMFYLCRLIAARHPQ